VIDAEVQATAVVLEVDRRQARAGEG